MEGHHMTNKQLISAETIAEFMRICTVYNVTDSRARKMLADFEADLRSNPRLPGLPSKRLFNRYMAVRGA